MIEQRNYALICLLLLYSVEDNFDIDDVQSAHMMLATRAHQPVLWLLISDFASHLLLAHDSTQCPTPASPPHRNRPRQPLPQLQRPSCPPSQHLLSVLCLPNSPTAASLPSQCRGPHLHKHPPYQARKGDSAFSCSEPTIRWSGAVGAADCSSRSLCFPAPSYRRSFG